MREESSGKIKKKKKPGLAATRRAGGLSKKSRDLPKVMREGGSGKKNKSRGLRVAKAMRKGGGQVYRRGRKLG